MGGRRNDYTPDQIETVEQLLARGGEITAVDDSASGEFHDGKKRNMREVRKLAHKKSRSRPFTTKGDERWA